MNKQEKEYSPSTMYEDYALIEYLFHWQSQNSASVKGDGEEDPVQSPKSPWLIS